MEYNFKGKTIPQLLEDSARRVPEQKALMVNKGDGNLNNVTYAELLERVRRLSSFIQREGFEKGSHIALLGKNSPEWATTYFAIQSAGYVVVPLDAALKSQELRHIIRHSDSTAIFLHSKHLDTVLDDGETLIEGIPYFELEKIDEYVNREVDPLPPRYPENDGSPAVIIYTSGTTGSPKGVILKHRNIVEDINSILLRIKVLPDDVFISVLPAHHVFEATGGFLTPIALGCGICYARALRGKEILEDIQASGATIILGVPLLFEKFYNGIRKALEAKGVLTSAMFYSALGISSLIDSVFGGNSGKVVMKKFRDKAGFGKLRLMVSGGAAIRTEVVEFFNSFGIDCLQGYGLTETSPVLAVNPPEKIKPASVGPPVDHVEIRIDGPNAEGIGEIQAKGGPVFEEYYKNPEATRETFTHDGWFKTGDLGKIDEDGYLYIMGRGKNLIVTCGGKNVYPEELEEKLSSSELVLESLVMAVRYGDCEEPFAILVPDFDAVDAHFDGAWTDEQLETIFKEIIENVNRNMAGYKRIKGFKIQREEFPKTSTRKIKRYLYIGKEIMV
ncbi:hypothetical protein DRQ36_06890 [bacterium]|nr:MAG: hypothetical protein DRQ36_06890 [bacterium]